MLKQIAIEKNKLEEFVLNLRISDRLELKHFLGADFKEEFIKKVLSDTNGTIFLANEKIPLALGGAEEINKNTGCVWLLCTNEIRNCRLELYKFVKAKIEEYKFQYEILFNYIYKSNFSALKWLKKCGFKICLTTNPDFKLFYFTRGEKNIDLRYFTREQL